MRRKNAARFLPPEKPLRCQIPEAPPLCRARSCRTRRSFSCARSASRSSTIAILMLYRKAAYKQLPTSFIKSFILIIAQLPGSVAAETGISCRKPGFRAKCLEKAAPARILKTEKPPTTAEGKEGCCASNRRADKQHGAGSLFSRAAPTVLRRALFVSPNGLLPRSGKLF